MQHAKVPASSVKTGIATSSIATSKNFTFKKGIILKKNSFVYLIIGTRLFCVENWFIVLAGDRVKYVGHLQSGMLPCQTPNR